MPALKRKTIEEDIISNKILVFVDQELQSAIPGFINVRQQELKLILMALREEDYPLIEFLGHALAANGMRFGFDTITEIGYLIVKEAMQRNSVATYRWVNVLIDYLNRVEITRKQ